MSLGDGGNVAVRLSSVRKVYGSEHGGVVALDGVSIEFLRGSFTAVMGPSGSGKSTFLHCAAGLDRPTSGSVLVQDHDLSDMDETALTRLRRERIAFIFQAFNLLPALTVAENVALPLLLAGRAPDPHTVRSVLAKVGLAQRIEHRPAQLSGGQQQRVALARALVTNSAVLLADEPTGALDTHTAAEVLSLLRDSVRTAAQTIVMVTHDPVAASYADRVVFLADGRLVGELWQPTAETVARQLASLGAWARRGSVPQGASS